MGRLSAFDPAKARQEAVRGLGALTARRFMLRHEWAKVPDPLSKRAADLLVAIAAISDRMDELLDLMNKYAAPTR